MCHKPIPSATATNHIRKLLIVRFSLLGDVAMTIPIIYSACEAYPDTQFIVITQQVASTLYVNAPANLTVEGIDHHHYSGYSGMVRLANYLSQRYHADAMIDLQGDRRSWLLCAAMRLYGTGQVHRIDMGNKGKRALTRRHNKRMFPLVTSLNRYHEVFTRIGMTFNETFSSIYPTGKPSPAIFAEITTPKQVGETWIAVAPFAKWSGKIYPMNLMEKVLDSISAWQNVRIFFLGQGDNERNQFRKWTKKYSNATSLAEKRNGFPTELALLSHCDVMLSMDNMNMHLASLVQLPVVSVWGASHPYCGFMGWKQSEDNVVQLNMVCRPCSLFGDKRCHYNDPFCLTGIQPQMIVSAVQRALAKKQIT